MSASANRRFVVVSMVESRAPAVGGSSSSAPATGCSRRASGSASSSGARSASCSRRSHCSRKRGRSRKPFRAIYRSTSRIEAEERLERFLAAVDRAAIPSFTAFAEGVRLWRQELLAYFDQPITNGYAEGVTNKIKVIKRRAYGLPTFNGFRQRVLVACG